MKKTLILGLALAVALMVGPASALTVNLIADGGDVLTAYDAGDVELSYDGTNLTVIVTVDDTIDDSVVLAETHVHVFTDDVDFTDIKLKRGGPSPGKFDYSESDPEATIDSPIQHTYTIPLTSTGEEKIAVHASIDYIEYVNGVDDPQADPSTWDDIYYDETGWAIGEDFPGSNWAMYIDLPWEVSAWDVTGDWILEVNTGTYVHEMTIEVQQEDGTISGIGRYPAGGPYAITWVMTGNVSGSIISMLLDYDGSTYTALLTGAIAADGSMSGTGTGGVVNWETTSGEATPTAWTLP